MYIHTGRTLLAVAIVALAAISGCSDNDNNTAKSSSGSSSSSSTSSSGAIVIEGLDNVQVHYPPPAASTSAEHIVIRGIVEQPEQVAAVYVNGEQVLSDDNLANWSQTVQLSAGVNQFVIEKEDFNGVRSEVQTLALERATEIVSPQTVVLDQANARVLLLDVARQTIISVDLDTGARSRLSPSTLGAGNLLTNAQGMALDAANNRLLVYQKQVVEAATDTSGETTGDGLASGETTDIDEFDEDDFVVTVNPFVAVDLTTGAQTVFDYTPPADIYLANSPRAITIADGVAYVADIEAVFVDAENKRVKPGDQTAVGFGTSGIISTMDLSTGQMQVFSNFGTPNRDVLIGNVRSVASADESDFVYVSDTTSKSNRILKLDKTSGQRTLFTIDGTIEGSDKTIKLSNPRSLTLDYANQRLLLVSDSRVLSVDLATGKVTVQAATKIPADSAYPLKQILSISLDRQNNVLYTADDASDSVLAIDGETGERRWIAGAGGDEPTGYGFFSTPACVALAPQQQSLVICDKAIATAFGYDLASGEKRIIVSSRDFSGEDNPPKILYPLSATHRSGGTFLLLDNRSQRPDISPSATDPRLLPRAADPRLLSLDSTSGELQVVHSFNNYYSRLNDVFYDAGRDAAYVADGNSIRELQFNGSNVTTARVFSGGNIPNREYRFQNLKSIAMDYQNNRLLAVDSSLNAVIAVDWHTGQRSPLSSMSVPANGGPNFKLPQALVVDSRNNRALVLDSALDAIVAVDLETGQREIVFQSNSDGAERMFNGKDLALHPFGYVLVVDDVKDTLMAIDLATPARPQQVMTLAR